MPNIELLNYEKHKDLRVVTQEFFSTGCDVGFAMVMPAEIPKVQREFPILFRKNQETGQFYAGAVLGFEHNENLYIDEGNWVSDYIPHTLRRGPFIIGFQDQVHDGKTVKTPVIYFDRDDRRISETQGEALFGPNGERTDTLDVISEVLMDINDDVERNDLMIATFAELNLIQPVNLGVEFGNGEKISIEHIYGISADTLAELDGLALEKLNKSGFLSVAFAIVGSLENFEYLVKRKEKTFLPAAV